MVKRAKLTLDHTDDADTSTDEPQAENTKTKNEKFQTAAQGRSAQFSNLGKILLITGLTIVTIAVLKRKIF